MAPALAGLKVSPGVPGADGGVKPILITGSVLAVSRLLRGLLEGSWLSRRALGLMRRIGEDEEPRSSCGRRALGLPSTVEELAGELESKEVEGDLERSMEFDSEEGEARPGDPATGDMEPILRNWSARSGVEERGQTESQACCDSGLAGTVGGEADGKKMGEGARKGAVARSVLARRACARPAWGDMVDCRRGEMGAPEKLRAGEAVRRVLASDRWCEVPLG